MIPFIFLKMQGNKISCWELSTGFCRLTAVATRQDSTSCVSGKCARSGLLRSPVKPAPQPDQDETGSIGDTAGCDVALLVEGKLFPQKKIFRCQRRRWTQTEAQETDDIDQQRQDDPSPDQ